MAKFYDKSSKLLIDINDLWAAVFKRVPDNDDGKIALRTCDDNAILLLTDKLAVRVQSLYRARQAAR